MTTLDTLLHDIFDGKSPALRSEFEGWVRGSRRYRAFVTDYRSKIRAKLRNVRDNDGLLDVRAELETAALLLHNSRFMLEYEKYAASRQRGPDFTVTFRTHTPFNVEVRRLRSAEWDDGDAEVRAGKLMSVLCDKVKQMPPGHINLLWLTSELVIDADDVAQAASTLRQLAERKAEDFFTRRGFENATDFLRQFVRLSGVVVRQPNGQALWLNPLSRHKTLPEIVTAITRLESD